jgi:UDP-N-acetylmuramate dehydrogenase
MRSPEPGVCLAPLTTLRIGGPAQWLIRAESSDDVRDALAWAREQGVPVFVVAGGSNVVIADEGFDGAVLSMLNRGLVRTADGDETLVTVQAGEPWDQFVGWTVDQGLAGVECLSGIPGTVGGTPIQNVGAYGQEVATTIASVQLFDTSVQEFVSLSAGECQFGYRTSRFKTCDAGRYVVCAVTFRLRRSRPVVTYPDLLRHLDESGRQSPTLAEVRAAVLSIRRRKGMVLDEHDGDTRSVGSFFTNPVVSEHIVERLAVIAGSAPPAYPAGEGRRKVPAAWLLEHSGFVCGFGSGSVGLSTKHPLAIINRGSATARAVVTFAAGVKQRVADRFGVNLVPEPTFVGFGDEPAVRYLVEGTA